MSVSNSAQDRPDRDTVPDRQASWSGVWATGILHSCVGSWEGNYGGAIRAFWARQLDPCHADLRMLDLCTGNGALPSLALELLGTERLPQIDAVDFSRPHPRWLDEAPAGVRDRIRFHPGVRIEDLPFGEGSFDWAVSQFGFEYADREAAAAELARVLAPSGRIVLACHYAQSLLARVAREEEVALAWMLDGSGLTETVEACLPLAAARRSDPEAKAIRERLNRQLAELGARARAAAVPDVLLECGERVLQLIRHAGEQGEASAREGLDRWRYALLAYRLRARELVDHALDDAAVASLEARFAQLGWSLSERCQLQDGERLLGIGLVWSR